MLQEQIFFDSAAQPVCPLPNNERTTDYCTNCTLGLVSSYALNTVHY